MSPIARRVLKERLRFVNRGERFTNIRGMSIFSNSNTCPSRTAKDSLFWDYIRQRLEGGRMRMNTNNRNLIMSSGLRNSSQQLKRKFNRTPTRQNVRGGNFTDMYNLYKKLFPGDYKVSFIGSSTPTFIFKTGTVFNPVEIHHGALYMLSHAYITMSGPESTHIVAGFMNRNGNPRIYDSAPDKFYNLNWSSRQFSQFGKYTHGIHKIAVYVRQ